MEEHRTPVTSLVFTVLFVFRYLRLIISIWAYANFKPRPIAEKPKYQNEDVTVVIPTTFANPGSLAECIRKIIRCSPAFLFIVTAEANVQLVKDMCAACGFYGIEILGVSKLNKRVQMMKALRVAETEITVFADDDVYWPDDYLDYLLAAFENPKVGAAGTRQRVRRHERPNFWNFLCIDYLERRNFNTGACNAIDGSLSTLSGRTAAYRTSVLKNEEFFYFFTHDSWLGHPLNTDDDKCLTRFVLGHGWEIALQFDPEAIIETTLEDNPKYIYQCVRWARAHWRGNFTVMTTEKYWWRTHIWGLYYIYIGQFQTPALFVDGILVYLLVNAMASFSEQTRVMSYFIFGLWLLFTKIVKLVPHLRRHPEDVKFLPVSVLFSYLHGFINIYALLTLHRASWGSQCLEELEKSRAENDEVLPLLQRVTGVGPDAGKIMVGDDYFSARPAR